MKLLIVYCGDCLWLLLLPSNVKSDLWSLLLLIDVTNSSTLQNANKHLLSLSILSGNLRLQPLISITHNYALAYLTRHKKQREMEGISIVQPEAWKLDPVPSIMK